MRNFFSKLIKAGNVLREFNFRQSSLSDDSSYSIDVPDGKGGRISFNMLRQENEWYFANDNLPVWVQEVEKLLATSIEENKPK